ncbi:hypothetical protein [Thalassobaculum sp.]|uniref:hypothetical protein n=1 Tax=Thalassobaculum sp. TaxID=2022740 RepID=UPI003B595729
MSQPNAVQTAEAASEKPSAPAASESFALTLAGEAVALKPTADGLIRMSRAFGGLLPAIDRVKAVDLDALGIVVHIGLGRPDGNTLQKTITAVAKSDLAEVTGACLGYVTRCLNGPAKTHETAT